ncbi:hypothetical protein PF003_g26702 [Phytophthora fragariae]|nr:hypothetical protein PF003_g26702 [Phytophthora fragariae]
MGSLRQLGKTLHVQFVAAVVVNRDDLVYRRRSRRD